MFMSEEPEIYKKSRMNPKSSQAWWDTLKKAKTGSQIQSQPGHCLKNKSKKGLGCTSGLRELA
jgi:hypothetical protein